MSARYAAAPIRTAKKCLESGQIMAAAAFLKQYPRPTDADIDANLTNICRCGTYVRIRRAIHCAAELMKT
jgi:isoquinoline 1-oxidoreductase subunit alpha